MFENYTIEQLENKNTKELKGLVTSELGLTNPRVIKQNQLYIEAKKKDDNINLTSKQGLVNFIKYLKKDNDQSQSDGQQNNDNSGITLFDVFFDDNQNDQKDDQKIQQTKTEIDSTDYTFNLSINATWIEDPTSPYSEDDIYKLLKDLQGTGSERVNYDTDTLIHSGKKAGSLTVEIIMKPDPNNVPPKRSDDLNRNKTEFNFTKGVDSEDRKNNARGENEKRTPRYPLINNKGKFNYDQIEKIIINNKVFLSAFGKLEPQSIRDEQIERERKKAKTKNRKIEVSRSVAGDYREKGFFNRSFSLYYQGLVDSKKLVVKKDSPYKLEIRGSEIYLILSIENKQFNFQIKIGEIRSHTRDSYWWNPISQVIKRQDGGIDYKNNDDVAFQLNKNEHYYDGSNIIIKEKTKGKVAIDESNQEIAYKKYCGKSSTVFIDLNYDICINENSIKVFNDIKNRLHKKYLKHNGNQHSQTVKYAGKQRNRIKKNVKHNLEKLLNVSKQNKYSDTIASRILSYYETSRVEFYEAKRHLSQQDATSLRKLTAQVTGIDPLEDI